MKHEADRASYRHKHPLGLASSWLDPTLLWYKTWDHSALFSLPPPSALWSLHLHGDKVWEKKSNYCFPPH